MSNNRDRSQLPQSPIENRQSKSRCLFASTFVGGFLEGDGEPEGSSLSGGAGDSDLAVHPLDQPAGDGQPQTRAFVAGTVAVQRYEGMEKGCLLFLTETDTGVGNG